MEIVEKKLIEFMKSTDEYLENVHYCNQLTFELLEIIKLQHTGNVFKEKSYTDIEKLHINMAKYYVKAFQIYSALQVINKIDILEIHGISSEEIKNFPTIIIQPTTTLHIAYNYIIELKTRYELKQSLMHTLDKMFNNDTFLLSLEEMDNLILETKKIISALTSNKNLLNIIELYNEKNIIEELKKYFL
jgi:hypothetical protein